MIEAPEKVTMYGADWCRDCRRSKALLDSLAADYDYVGVEHSEEATERARAISGRPNIPVIHFPDGSHLVEPSDRELQAKLAAD